VAGADQPAGVCLDVDAGARRYRVDAGPTALRSPVTMRSLSMIAAGAVDEAAADERYQRRRRTPATAGHERVLRFACA
jgi:hypothetical protein